jgi:hypothetical protein
MPEDDRQIEEENDWQRLEEQEYIDSVSEDNDPYGNNEDYIESEDLYTEDQLLEEQESIGDMYTDEYISSMSDDVYYAQDIPEYGGGQNEEEVEVSEEVILEQEEIYSEEKDKIEWFHKRNPIPKLTIEKLSKARFNKLNLELVFNNEPTINSLKEEEMFDILLSSLGNAELPYQKKKSQYGLTQKFTTYLLNQNCGYDIKELGLRFKDRLFNNFAKIPKKHINPSFTTFKNRIKLPIAYEGTNDLICLSYDGELGMPKYLLASNTSIAIKKLFAFEILNDELKERERIKESLNSQIKSYEKVLMNCYNKIVGIKSIKTNTIHEAKLNYKIGLIHLALEEEGYETLFKNKILKEGRLTIPKEIKEYKKSAVEEGIEMPDFTVRIPVDNKISLFRRFNTNNFEFKDYTIDQFEKQTQIRKEMLDDNEKDDDGSNF